MRRNRNDRFRLAVAATALLATTCCLPQVHGQADPFGETAEPGAAESGVAESAGSDATAVAPGARATSSYGLAAPSRSDDIAELLGRAMTRNPDIAVAEAKVRSAQVELDRTRLDVSRRIIDAVLAIRHQRKVVDVSKLQLAASKQHQDMLKRHAEKGIVSTMEVTSALAAVGTAELALAKAEAQLETAVAALDYLTGGQSMPGFEMGMQRMMGTRSAMGDFLPRRNSSLSAGGASESHGPAAASTGSPANSAKAVEADSGGAASTKWPRRGPANGGRVALLGPKSATTFHERLRTKLGEPTTLEFVDAPLGEVMSFLDDVHGITNIIIDRETPDDRELASEPITLKLENVPLSAALKAIKDIADVHFVVTEYGLRVTTKDVEIEESVPLREFLKSAYYDFRIYGADTGEATAPAESNPFATRSEPANKVRRPAFDPFSTGGGEAEGHGETSRDASDSGQTPATADEEPK